MNLLDKTDQEILEIANPLWDNLIRSGTFDFDLNFDYCGSSGHTCSSLE